MIKRLLLTVVAAVAISSFTSYAQRNDWANFGRFEQENKELLASPTPSKRLVVFLGNSITEGWANMRPSFFTDNDFVGRGISGQTSYQFLLRFRDDVINLHPRAVVINAGTNDVAENNHVYNEDRTFGNIVSMAELAKANNIKVILTTVLPATGFGWNGSVKDAPEKIKSLNARIADYAHENKIPFVDYFTPLVAEDGKSLPARYSRDGVHPTEAGYEIMEATVLPVVRKIVK